MKRILSMIICLSFLFAQIAFGEGAEGTVTAKIIGDVDNQSGAMIQVLTVSGDFPVSYANRMVSLRVAQSSGTLSEPPQEKEAYVYLAQGQIESDGSYSFTTRFNEDTGYYAVYVLPEGGDTVSTVFYLFNTQILSNLINKINNNEYNAESLATEISSHYQELNLDTSIYLLLTSDQKREIAERMLDAVPLSIETIGRVFDTQTILVALSKNENSEMVRRILTYYEKDYLKLAINSQEDLYTVYSDFSESEKNQTAAFLGKRNYQALEDVQMQFGYGVLLTLYKNLINHRALEPLLNKYRNVLNLPSYSLYCNLKEEEQSTINAYIVQQGNKVSTIEEFVSLYEYAMKNLDNLSPKDQPSDNSGRSGTRLSSRAVILNEQQVLLPNVISDTTSETFTDLSELDWAKEAILSLYQSGVIKGKGNGRFAPEDKITRSEFTKILVDALELKKESATCSFSDVPEDAWYYNAVAVGSSTGLILGISDSYFGAEEPITREDMATLIYRVIMYQGKVPKMSSYENTFSDYDAISDYAKNSVMMLNKLSIIQGFDDGTFRPKNNSTRAEAAQMIYNTLKIVSMEGVADDSK